MRATRWRRRVARVDRRIHHFTASPSRLKNATACGSCTVAVQTWLHGAATQQLEGGPPRPTHDTSPEASPAGLLAAGAVAPAARVAAAPAASAGAAPRARGAARARARAPATVAVDADAAEAPG